MGQKNVLLDIKQQVEAELHDLDDVLDSKYPPVMS